MPKSLDDQQKRRLLRRLQRNPISAEIVNVVKDTKGLFTIAHVHAKVCERFKDIPKPWMRRRVGVTIRILMAVFPIEITNVVTRRVPPIYKMPDE